MCVLLSEYFVFIFCIFLWCLTLYSVHLTSLCEAEVKQEL